MIGSRVGNIFIHENLIPNLTIKAYWNALSNLSEEVRMRSPTGCVLNVHLLHFRTSLSTPQHILFSQSPMLLLEDGGLITLQHHIHTLLD